MTRAQRRAHRVAWIALGLVLLALGAWAFRTREVARERMHDEVPA